MWPNYGDTNWTVTLGWLPQIATISQFQAAPSNSLMRYRDAGTAVGQEGQ